MVEHQPAVLVAQQPATCPFGMGHHAENIPFRITDACNIVQGSIGVPCGIDAPLVIAVSVNDLPVHFHLLHSFGVRKETSFPMSYWYHQGLGAISGTFSDKYILTYKSLLAVTQEHAG